jgi:hypothetical protein
MTINQKAALARLGALNTQQREDLKAALSTVATDSLMPDELDGETAACAMELIQTFNLDTARNLAELTPITGD